MKISVVIPTKDRPTELAVLLRALAAQTRAPDEVVVVDAGSPGFAASEVFRTLRERGIPCRRIPSRPNLPRQKNVGALAADGDLLFFFDDDMSPAADYLAVMENAFKCRPDYGGGMGGLPPATHRRSPGNLLCRLFLLQHEHGDGGFYLSGMPRHPYGNDTPMDTAVMGGGLMAVRRSVFAAAGLRFDEDLVFSQEDADFSFRLSRTQRLFFLPEAKVDHFPSAQGRPGAFEEARRYMVNYRHLYRKNFFSTRPWTLPLHWWAVLGMFVVALLTAPRGTVRGYWHGLASSLQGDHGAIPFIVALAFVPRALQLINDRT